MITIIVIIIIIIIIITTTIIINIIIIITIIKIIKIIILIIIITTIITIIIIIILITIIIITVTTTTRGLSKSDCRYFSQGMFLYHHHGWPRNALFFFVDIVSVFGRLSKNILQNIGIHFSIFFPRVRHFVSSPQLRRFVVCGCRFFLEFLNFISSVF